MEEHLGAFHLAPDDGYSSAVTLNRTAVSRSMVALSRVRDQVRRRGPRRVAQSTRTIRSQYSVGWNVELSDDLVSLRFILESLCDRGGTTAVTGGHQWTIGRPGPCRTFSAYAVSGDQRSYRLRRGFAQDFAMTVEPRRLVGMETRWAFAEIEETAVAAATDTADPANVACGLEASLTWDAVSLPVFSFALHMGRSLEPAGFTPDGVASGSAGRVVPDITGRMTCRVLLADEDLFLTEVTRSLVLTMLVGGVTVTVTLPSVTFESVSRTVVAAGFVEHSIEFVATMPSTTPLATIVMSSI